MEKKTNAEETVQTTVSNSKQKRIDRVKKNEEKKRQGIIANVVIALIVVAVLAVIGCGVYSVIAKAAEELKPNSDYSAQLDDNGHIKGVKTSNYIDLVDYKNIKVPLSEVEYPDESVEADIKTALESHKVLKTEDVEVKDGDTVNIDYVGSIDGVEFEGGNSNEQGFDLVIGSGSFIDGFEQQLIGSKPNEQVMVNVTFPEEYQSEELAGKDAEFAVTVHGVYVVPEFDDDFVCAYYSEFATTADGYRQYLKDTNYDSKLTEYVAKYIVDNSNLIKYPKKFLKSIEESTMYGDYQQYEYMNQLYQQYYGQGFSSFEEYNEKSEVEYRAELIASSQQAVKADLVYQGILEQEGIVLTEADLRDMVTKNNGEGEENYNALLSTYGKGYMMLALSEEKAVEIAKSYAVVE